MSFIDKIQLLLRNQNFILFPYILLFLAPFTVLGFVGAVEDTDAGNPVDPPGVDPRGITTPLCKEAAQR